MKSFNKSRILPLTGLFLGALVWLANNANPPNAYTGAPFDNGTCNSCHGGGSYTATASIDGLPGTISPNTTYPLTLTVTPTAGSPVKAGFQLVAVQGNNANAGSLAAGNSQTGVETFNGRQYLEHRNGKLFGGNPVSWTFNWTSPASSSGNTVTFYYIANICDGNGNTSGDIAYSFNETYPFSGPPPITASISSTTNVTCNGGANGSATVEPAGGTSPYTYHWNNNQTTQTAINLAAGTYTVTVTGASGSGTVTATAVITQPPAIVVSASATGTITCIQTTATGTASASGGNGGFTFDWSNGSTGSPITFTAGGVYTVTATDNQGCTKTSTVTVAANIIQPNAVATAGGTLSCAQTTVSVNGTGSSTGTNISYSWTTTDGHIVSGTNNINAVVNQAGTYELVVTNSVNGCTKSASTTVTTTATPPNATAGGGVLTCTNPSINLTGNSTTPGVTFSWTGPGGFTSGQQNPSVSVSGVYTLLVTNPANNCTATATATVTANNTPPVVTATPGATITCSNPTAQLSASAGAGTFTYAWSGPNNFTSTQQNPTVSAGGTYILTVTSGSNGCASTASASQSANTTLPGVTASGGTISCITPSVTINAVSGTSGVTYSWTGPSNFTSSAQNPSVSTAGTYAVVVKNPVNNCTSTATAVVNGDIIPPNATASAGPTITCVTTSSQVIAGSTTSGATFAWTGPNNFTSSQPTATVSTGGTYLLTVTGPNSCTSTASATVSQNTALPGAGATGGVINCVNPNVTLMGTTSGAQPGFAWSGPGGISSTQQNYTVTTPGAYSLVVTDGVNGCTSTASATVTSNTTPPVAAASVPGNLNCHNATIQINGTASSQGNSFTYLWTTTNGHIVSGANTLTPVVDQGGTYALLVTNTDNSCTATVAATVIQNPPVVASITSITGVACNGNSNGAATAAGTGGNGAFSYLWSSGATTATASSLAAGTYVVTITDGENCTSTVSAVVAQPDPLAANAVATSETALGANNGTATAVPAGGTPPYLYTWNNGGTTPTITGLSPGSYTVSVTDTHGCSSIQTVTVNSFNCTISSALTSSNVICFGAANGTAALAVTGAANPITYTWSTGATTPAISGLGPGTYTVQIMDGNGCPATQSTVITEPPVVSVNANATNLTGVGTNNGTATAAPTGGTAPYLFLWSTGATTSMISNLSPGAYTVTVADANSCTAVQTVNVNPFNCALTASSTTVNVACNGGTDGLATVTLSGGTSPITYVWSNGATTPTISNLAAGLYTATLTDGVGCIINQSVTITQPSALSANATAQNVPCPESQTGSITVTTSGGIPPYNYTWSSGNGTNLGVGNYAFTITDAHGCTSSHSVSIVSTDVTPPTLVCPNSTSLCGVQAVNYPAPTASDNCSLAGASPVLTSGQASGTSFPIGATTQVFKITDASGNTSTCSFTVTVNAQPTVALTAQTDDVNGAGNGSIKINVTGGSGTFAYQWTKDGTSFSNSENLNGLHEGSYVLVVTDANGCTATLPAVVIKTVVGTFDPGTSISFRLMPNPANTSFRVQMDGFQVTSAQIADLRGRLVQEIQPDDLATGVDVNQLPTGLYFLRMQTQSGQWLVVKWVKSE
jgi:hypothetical protein